ncbi:MAG: formylglycine-generating enzyme family protein, partial [Planctomycetia bacterium]|nr:formylglycine-generating enzyme family protein [Planctomycetia bacterium]
TVNVKGEKPDDSFVFIPANESFQFAVSLDKRGQGEDSPIMSAYCLAKYPVTNSEYKKFLDETNKFDPPQYWKNGTWPEGKEKHPVLDVSYDEAQAYCQWLESKNSKWHFRLPTEAEWENAAMGPSKNIFPWGDETDNEMSRDKFKTRFNFNGVVAFHYLNTDPARMVEFNHAKSDRRGQRVRLADLISVDESGRVRGWIDHRSYTGFVYTDLFKEISRTGGFTTPVDDYPDGKSEYGCFDMAGNSWDWTSSDIIATNGAEKGQSVKAIRGGSWYATMNSCRTTFRGEGRRPRGSFNTVGFRVVAEPK